jgi:hypothetical protein
MGPEEKKFNEWFERKKKEGMVDFKLCIDENASLNDREVLCAEINAMNDAIDAGKGVPIDWKKIEGI